LCSEATADVSSLVVIAVSSTRPFNYAMYFSLSNSNWYMVDLHVVADDLACNMFSGMFSVLD